MSRHGSSSARDFCPDLGRSIVARPLDRDHGGNIYAWARQVSTEPAAIVDFSASINPLGPPAAARRVFQKSYSDVKRYPDPYCEQLKEVLAKHHGMKPAEILVGNGSTQLIYLLCFALRPRKALVVGPAFSEHTNALMLAGTRVSFFSLTPDRDFRFSIEYFMAAWEKAPELAFLTTPNSVTGQLIPREEIEIIARSALLKKRFLVIDEAFIDFVERESVKQLIRDNPFVIILRSLTKYYALAGLRLGYLLAHSRRAAQLATFLEPWSVNGPAQKVALACLADRHFAWKTERWLFRERDFLSDRLMELKRFQPYPSNANFLLVRITNNASAFGLSAFLLQKKILIRTCNSFTGLGSSHFRIAVRQRKDNLRLLEALRAWASESLP